MVGGTRRWSTWTCHQLRMQLWFTALGYITDGGQKTSDNCGFTKQCSLGTVYGDDECEWKQRGYSDISGFFTELGIIIKILAFVEENASKEGSTICIQAVGQSFTVGITNLGYRGES